MPNSETLKETEKQPTGSSKRKRKHSIKRNIDVDDNSNCSDTYKLTKVKRTYGKKFKGDKGKLKNENEEMKKENEAVVVMPQCKQEKNESENYNECVKTEIEEQNCENHKITESDAGQCTSTREQCQNCKFCSEHVVIKKEEGNDKEKQTKSKKKFICEICAKDGSTRVYNSVQKHKDHLATVHEIYNEEIKKFECTDCPETVWFPTKSKYTYHLGTKHPGVMRFICEVCTETFILKANYKNHMKTHNLVVQKKFSCNVCNGTFVNKAGFEAHKKRFPGPHIKQSCSHCGFSFSREKHMKNHRCKTLLLEEAARANKAQQIQTPLLTEEPESHLKVSSDTDLKISVGTQMFVDKKTADASTEVDLSLKKETNDVDPQSNKRIVFHRIIPRRSQEQTVYRPVQMQAQSITESVVVQELREIDLESGTFIATAATEPEQQFIVRDINGHLLQGNQILQLDINDIQQGEESQVYLADWNIVAPYVIREKSP